MLPILPYWRTEGWLPNKMPPDGGLKNEVLLLSRFSPRIQRLIALYFTQRALRFCKKDQKIENHCERIIKGVSAFFHDKCLFKTKWERMATDLGRLCRSPPNSEPNAIGVSEYYAITTLQSLLHVCQFTKSDFQFTRGVGLVILRSLWAEQFRPFPNGLLWKVIATRQNQLLGLFVPIENFPTSWLTTNTTALASSIYKEQKWELCPVLADAMMDAGCEDEEIIDLLRNRWSDMGRGVWLIDHLCGWQ